MSLVSLQITPDLRFLDPAVVRGVSDICRPLLNPKEISFFYFARVFDSGACDILSHHPGAMRYIFEHKMRVTADIPKETVAQEFWYVIPRDEKYARPLQDYKSLFNIGSLVDYIRRYDGFYEMYCFGTETTQTETAASLFLNRKEKLRKFSENFKRRLKSVIQRPEQIRIKLPPVMKPTLTGLGRAMETQPGMQFTQRELDCISFLPLGYTAKEIARELSLSMRTVEFYLGNVKAKLGCSRRSEVIRLLNDNGVI